MKIFEKVAYQLVDEFKNPTFEIIKLGGPNSGRLENERARFFDSEEENKDYWHFDFVFRNHYMNSTTNIVDIEPTYKRHIDKLCKSFFQEISTEIDENNKVQILNMLTDYSQMFRDLKEGFILVTITRKNYYNELTDNVCLPINFDKIVDQFSIHRLGHLRILFNSFYKTQNETINKILEFIEMKLKILNVGEHNAKEATKRIPPSRSNNKTEKLDRYQTALLFHYLEELEVINKNSYITQAEIINRLTGISAQKLRSDGLNKIWEIKSGALGNTIELRTDPAYALKGIKKLFEEILVRIDADLRKNLENIKKL